MLENNIKIRSEIFNFILFHQIASRIKYIQSNMIESTEWKSSKMIIYYSFITGCHLDSTSMLSAANYIYFLILPT